MKKPVIGILGNVWFVNEPEIQNAQYKMYMNQTYMESVKRSGGIPVLFPPTKEYDGEELEQFVTMMDGLLLPGGDDIAPYFYGEEPHPATGYFLSWVDKAHLEAAKIAEKLGKPVLGICRGMQILNIAFGGTLYQDLPSQKEGVIQHSQKAPRCEGSHYITVKEDTFLNQWTGETKLLVNSHHHQAVKKLAEDFRVIAEASDGVIEAIEHENGTPMVGVQWHPEALTMSGVKEEKKIFEGFVKLCKK